jgi:purine-binding chemotaxis protein CheW
MKHTLQASSPSQEFVLFVVGGELFATELTTIGEVVRPGPLTYVPGARPDVRGVTSVRGRIVAVVDMCRALCLTENPNAERKNARLMIAEYDEEAVGFMVEEVREVVSILDSAIEDASTLGTPEKTYLRGVTRVAGKTVVLVSIDALSPITATQAREEA